MDKDALLDYEYPDLDPLPTKMEAEWVHSYCLFEDLKMVLLGQNVINLV